MTDAIREQLDRLDEQVAAGRELTQKETEALQLIAEMLRTLVTTEEP